MGEFGHIHGHCGSSGFIDAWGAGPFLMVVDGKRFRFEDSDRFGPARVNKDGDPSAVNFGARSPFWEAHRLWVSQGRQLMHDNYTCLWRPAIPTIIQKIGNLRLTLQKGEPNAYGAIRQIMVEAPRKPVK